MEGLSYIKAEGGPADRTYTLVLDGATYQLRKKDGTANVWYAVEAPWRFKIVHNEDINGDPAGEWKWDVWSAEGARYEFTGFLTYRDDNCALPRTTYVRWMVTKITAAADAGTNAYALSFDYATHARPAYGVCNSNTWQHVHAVWPTQITYSGVQGTALVAQFLYETDAQGNLVARSDRPGGPGEIFGCNDLDCTNQPHAYYQYTTLRDIVLKAGDVTVRRYHLDNRVPWLGAPPDQQRLFLYGVYVYGQGTTTDPWPATPNPNAETPNPGLPDTPERVIFTYWNFGNTDWSGSGNSRLWKVIDRQGAKATLTYEMVDGRVELQKLVSLVREDGMGGVGQAWLQYGSFNTNTGGFDQVSVQQPSGAWRTQMFFNANNDAKGKRGQLKLLARQKDAAGGYAWVEQWDKEYVQPPLPEGSTYDRDSIVQQPLTIRRSLYNDQGSYLPVSHTVYTYTLDHQGGGQYGNVTAQWEWEYKNSVWSLGRTHERWFYPCDSCNGESYIVNRLAEEKVWQGDVGGTCQSQRRWFYDGAASHTSPPVRGLLTKVQGARAACDSDLVTLVENAYDPTWHNLTRSQDGLGHGLTTVYDSEFHAFVTSQSNDLSQATTVTYPPADVVQRALGMPYQITDPNSQVTSYTYDAWGRLLTVDRPLGGAPDERWVYTNYAGAASPARIRHEVRDDVTTPAPQDGYLKTWTYYDGLGRVIQTQSERDEGGGRRRRWSAGSTMPRGDRAGRACPPR